MALSVQTNNAAMTALKNLNTNSLAMNNSLNRLSSGFRINSAADDASGFAVSSKLSAQGAALKAASQNATQATAMVKMADAGVNEIQNMVVRIQTLATQASSANSSGELAKLDAERVKLETQIDKIAQSTKYNGVSLLNGTAGATGSTANGAGTSANVLIAGTGTFNQTVGGGNFDGAAAGAYTLAVITRPSQGGTANMTITKGAQTETINFTDATGTNATTVTSKLFNFTFNVGASADTGTSSATLTVASGSTTFQVGADNNTNNQVVVALSNSYTSTALNLGSGTGTNAAKDITTQAGAQAYITIAQNALNTLVTQRADLGATQNQLGFVTANLATSIEQVTSAVSTIKDADMAAEMANFTKNKILTQAGTSMLAQANQAAQNVMTLFR